MNFQSITDLQLISYHMLSMTTLILPRILTAVAWLYNLRRVLCNTAVSPPALRASLLIN